ncbi:nitroreductase family protein [Stutzerimonas kirkiae]|uniref:nitroreductase family protein n=1 Tax=Stutzerimonas kirkiae TaxID=2211392 RepID=UPI0010385671|nr:nitroreductase family protein [Stutzerimonas kirkiae]TBV17526.1 nitroreductase family protein [Stutzerimonas kirkiae]
MNTSIQNAIETRTSVNNFQPDRPLDDGAIAKLVNLAAKAPSAYNLQNWRFIAVRSENAKARLKSAAFGQQKVVDASVTFIICGTLAAHGHLRTALQPSIEANIMNQRVVDAWVAQATASHEDNSVLQRDEAVRSASLAAMTLMLAAQGMGLGSCAMGGFDAERVAQEFELSVTELPVVIVAVGHPEISNWPQKPRKPLPEVLAIV